MRVDPTKRFSGRVESYARHRPTYPTAVIDVLRIRASLTPESVVADIGSGTGILSELFLKAGNTVFAVEPNADMRAAAEKLLSEYPLFHSVAGTAEETTLSAHRADLIAAGQAFHWFDRAKSRKEFLRIARGSATVALLWNDRKTSGTSFSQRYEALLRRFGTDYTAVDHKNLGSEVFDRFFGVGRWTLVRLPNEQRFDLDGLRGRLLSSSYTPAPGEPRHAEMMDEAETIFAATQKDGLVRMEYDTTIYIGNLRNPEG